MRISACGGFAKTDKSLKLVVSPLILVVSHRNVDADIFPVIELWWTTALPVVCWLVACLHAWSVNFCLQPKAICDKRLYNVVVLPMSTDANKEKVHVWYATYCSSLSSDTFSFFFLLLFSVLSKSNLVMRRQSW